MDDLLFESACSMIQALRTRSVSSVELVEAHLARIEAVNPRINAVVQLASARALREARAADEAFARGQDLGPLQGLPITIKDSLDTAGVVTTWGTTGRRTFVPEADAPVVARLRKAGAIVLGKSNTSELTLGGEMDNAIYGPTHNPHDTTLSPAGSSGGAAAIVAAGGAAFDIGSDTGGSIREPAHVCGIAGLKPTAGRTPRTGHAVPPGLGAVDGLTVLGPLARRVEDLALVLPVICGPDWHDPAVVPMALGDPAAVRLEGLRIAAYSDGGLAPPKPEIAALLRRAADALAGRGAVVEEAAPAVLPQAAELYPRLHLANGRNWLRRQLAQAGTATPGPHVARLLAREAVHEAPSLAQVSAQLESFRSKMLGFLQSYDGILCPAGCKPAVPHGISRLDGMDRVWGHLYAYNLTGWPAAVVPAGVSESGLPMGVQLVARPWREDVALALAGAIEQDLAAHRRPTL
ncbi:MAG: amidase [Pseudomonadota bacterium]